MTEHGVTASRGEAAGASVLRLSALPALLLFTWLAALGFVLRLSPDEGVVAVTEIGIFDGKWPYRDFFTNRQPMTFLWYLPLGLGASIAVQRIFAAAAMAVSVPLVALVAGRWFGPERRLMAAIVYALLLANPLMPVQGNVEAYLLPLIVGAVAAPAAAPAGLLFGLAVTTKLHALVFAPVLILLWRRDLTAFVFAALVVCVIASLPFLVIWRDYKASNVDFMLAFADYTSDDRAGRLLDVSYLLIIAMLPVWIAGSIGVALCRERAALIVWALCGVVAVKVSGFDYDHYYALLMPPLALLASEGLLYVHRHRSLRYVFAPAGGVALLLCGLTVIAVVDTAGRSPSERLADAIGSEPGEVYVLGSRPEVYVYAERQPQRRFFFSIPLVMKEDWGEETRAGLLACPPAVLVVPETDIYEVDWRDEVERLYAERADYDGGSVFTEPTAATADAEPNCGSGVHVSREGLRRRE